MSTIYKTLKDTSGNSIAPRTKTTVVTDSDGNTVDELLADKVDKVSGKSLSTEDYTTAEKTKLSGIATGATAVSESTVTGWGFTKNTGTYSKPDGGIPSSDLASAVQTSLGKADSALQSVPNTYRTSSAQDVIDATKATKPITETYTIATASWSALASSTPYTYSATVTATHTIGNDTVCKLINDNAVLFATYGFAIGAVSGQSVTIYSIGQPSASVTLEVDYIG